MNPITPPLVLIVFIGLITSVLNAADTARPNIVIIMADDCTYSDLSLYGGVNVETPHIDRLAEQGMTFDQVYVSMSMCVPCRASLHTGLYPLRNGAAWNHSPAKEGIKSTPHYLGELGYRVALTGKTHLNPKSNYPFEIIRGAEENCVADTSYFDAKPIREFMDRDPNQPFALTVALTSPHAPWTVGDPSHFDVETFEMPDHLADTPITRQEFAKYLAEVEVLDEQVGQTLEILDELGIADNTLVIFTSEQGAQFPGCKWTNWAAGVRTGFVVRWSGHVEFNTRTDAIVQYCDVLPTLIELAGGNPEEADFDGSTFLDVLKGETEEHREFAFFMHNNVPEGPSYPIRGVTDGKYHYLRNLSPDRIYIEKHLFSKFEHNAYIPSWFWTSTDTERSYNLMERFIRRPAEELYDNEADPSQMQNIVLAEPKVRKRMSKALDTWMAQQGDPGAEMDDFDSLKKARKQKHEY